MSNQEELSLEENEQLSAIILSPMMQLIDMASEMYDVKRLRATLKKMNNHASSLAAWPMQETMDEADRVASINNVFEKFVEMVELREDQKEIAIKAAIDKNSKNDFLKQLGLS